MFYRQVVDIGGNIMTKQDNAESDFISRRCLSCDYALDHLPSTRCPECGREFDPGDSRSFSSGNLLKYGMLTPTALRNLVFIAVALDFTVWWAVREFEFLACVWCTVVGFVHVSLLCFAFVAAVEDRKPQWVIMLFAALVGLWPVVWLVHKVFTIKLKLF